MKKSVFLLASLMLCLISGTVFAECAARAVYRAPEIPKLNETSFEQVVKLGQDVRDYMDDADRRLEKCGNKASPLSHNLAIGRMERVAKAYNELAVFYNQTNLAAN
ncbi:Uncharacterised protein [Zhongshania aliphaticivorans]|uniref:Uncharacterized protein n=1 Tax=Zhongshania aliphaticivorans TaxID=1470434 RepID=A0A5S9PM53_9GAMM|nr:hypothetical protein [Zhongshania aliphaticivorans]CAA0104737.1 Uncharacterised protein [Zhongshania aliphaticivorans]CAA0104994.1 Uncharacterised protein [Zhongshania aliphaticivorans]